MRNGCFYGAISSDNNIGLPFLVPLSFTSYGTTKKNPKTTCDCIFAYQTKFQSEEELHKKMNCFSLK